MSYKYITENNLEHRQNYMYSAFNGHEFLTDYYITRQRFLGLHRDDKVDAIDVLAMNVEDFQTDTEKRLCEMYANLRDGEFSKESKEILDGFLQSFEIRKRIYDRYIPGTFRPMEGVGYVCIRSYLILSANLWYGYRHTRCLKYFSCMLKVDDTLISIADAMGDKEREALAQVLGRELEIYWVLCEKNGMGGHVHDS